MAKISFTANQQNFSITLRKKVDEYFISRKIKLTGNKKLYTKTIVLFTMAIATYTILVFFTPPVFISVLLCIIFGMNVAAIGFNVMHDGAHGSYSQKKWVNDLMANTLNLLGGSSYLWKLKHNVNHHSFTNIEGADDDIDIRPWIRTNENQEKKWFHRYQHIYWVFLYCLAYVSWVYLLDFKKYFSGKISGEKFKKMKMNDHIIFWASKFLYTFIFLIVPIIYIGFVKTIIGFTIFTFVCGLVLSIVFQLAHVVEGAAFPDLGPDNSIENDWTVHQLTTTANFSTRSAFMTWFAGGLNYQVEHHLFPRISHIHYPEISKVVKQVCDEFKIPYMEHPTFLQAINAHVRHLKAIG